MEIIAIDLGSYSIKTVRCLTDKKSVFVKSLKEYSLEQYREDHGQELSDEEIQIEILKEISETVKKETKVIAQVPADYLTLRFLNLPVKNKKKAEQMIPFQLEEDLPFSLSTVHLASTIEVGKEISQAQVNIAGLTGFQELHQELSQSLLPDVLTSESSIYANYVKQKKLAGPFCVLDLGHTSCKAYFFYEQQLVGVQTSFIAGKAITQSIAENYQIPLDEAQIFKHQNGFVLHESQIEDVSKEQKDFAIVMNKVLAPFINDFKRWELGYRLQTNNSLQTIFITGGTSNLKNMANYLAQSLSVKVQHLNILDAVEYNSQDSDPKQQMKFSNSSLLAWSYLHKNKIVNFLTGEFERTDKENIPVHSIFHISLRASIIAFFLITLFITEKFMLDFKIKDVDKKINTLLKNPTLNANQKDQREYKKKPERTLSFLNTKARALKGEFSGIQALAKINATSPLVKLSQIVKNDPDISLSFLSISDGTVSGLFEAKQIEKLNSLKQNLESAGLKDFKANINTSESKMMINFSEDV
jgi:general secretion pathway protein L